MKYFTLSLFISIIFINSLFADIEVKKSAGAETASSTTTIILNSNNSQEQVPIYQVLNESSMMGTGNAGSNLISFGASGQTIRLLCEAPAELVLDGGIYQFQCSKSVIFNGGFQINAKGGTQIWEIKKGWPAAAPPLIMSGIITAICGPMMLTMGALIDDTEAFLIGGGIMTIYGATALTLGILNKPSAKLVAQK